MIISTTVSVLTRRPSFAGNHTRKVGNPALRFDHYDTEGFYDEIIGDNGEPRAYARVLVEFIESIGTEELLRRQKSAERLLLQLGITFNVYGDSEGTERIFPFDLVPRVVSSHEWQRLEAGLQQRIRALNLFVDDIYHDRKIVRDGVVPAQVIASADSLRPECQGLNPPHGIWCHITGTDLVRDSDGTVYVLEDNLRVPSGVSYVLQTRQVMKQTFPQLFEGSSIRPVDDYPSRLLEMLQEVGPPGITDPRVAVLTPGIFNSAYFEHSFLAQQMGCQLVEGRDLVVSDNVVLMRTTKGFERVDVIYRRIDDDYLDPRTFRPDSLIGIPGLMDAYRAGHVTLANAPGTGVADDKVVYAFVPEIVKYYLGEDILIPNVPTYLCWRDTDRSFVLANLDKLVVKSANGSGGYGMLVGPHSSRAEREEFADRIKEKPRNYVAQPTLSLSCVPTIVGERFEGRHVDLRPFIVHGRDEIYVTPGGLTRVALRKGSLVVNSSQGGGSKATWVLEDGRPDGGAQQ